MIFDEEDHHMIQVIPMIDHQTHIQMASQIKDHSLKQKKPVIYRIFSLFI